MIKIEVKQKHIDCGERKNAKRCAIAQAINEVYPSERVLVDDARSIFIGSVRYQAEDLDGVDIFIAEFDEGNTVEPFTLTLEEDNECEY